MESRLISRFGFSDYEIIVLHRERQRKLNCNINPTSRRERKEERTSRDGDKKTTHTLPSTIDTVLYIS